eukprot:15484219-Alexandrium_andersonii.AAC.1
MYFDLGPGCGHPSCLPPPASSPRSVPRRAWPSAWPDHPAPSAGSTTMLFVVAQVSATPVLNLPTKVATS